MKINKLMAVVLCLMLMGMIMPSFNISYSASAETPIWDGTCNTDWYDSEATELRISTAEELAGMAQLVNSGKTMEGQTIYLDDDIYLNDVSNYENWEIEAPANSWTPIGKDKTYYFDGVFDCQGHNINGLYSKESVHASYTAYAGFFGCNGANSVIKNVSLDFGYVTYSYKGNFGFYSSETGQEHHYLGGISAYNAAGTIAECAYNGTIKADVYYSLTTSANYRLNNYSGAICGYNASGIISDCLATGNIFADISCLVSSAGDYSGYVMEYTGGICGYNQTGEIKRCGNRASVTNTTSCDGNGNVYSGGICGYGEGNSFTVSECYNLGTITSSDAASINSGGICGYATRIYFIDNCYNWGDITVSNVDRGYAGGIVGYTIGYTTAASGSIEYSYTNVYNTGRISADEYASGTLGYISETTLLPVMNNCYYLVDNSTTGIGNSTENTILKPVTK